MKEKVLFLVRYYVALLISFIPLRLVFLISNSTENYTFRDCIDVVVNGLPLDIAVAGYLTAIPLILTISGVFMRLPARKLLIAYNIFTALVISAAFIADISLYPFWEFKLDSSFLIYIDSPANAFASVGTGYIISRVIIVSVLSIAIFILLHKATTKELVPERKPVTALTVLTLIGALLFLGIRGGVGESTNNIGKAYYSDRQFLNHSAVNPIFSFVYSVGKQDDLSTEYSFYNEEELDNITADLYPKDNAITDTLLNTSRPNIITIILEGMGSNLIGSLDGQRGITPNFDKLVEEGIIFTNCHANSYRTDRGIICALSGYASFPKTSVMKSPIKSRNLPSLALSLKEAGYHNTFLYGGDINFTNMKSYLFASGYSELISDKDFTIKQQETHKWGVTDHIMFDSLLSMTTTRPKEPWHITYLTLSSHEPWEVPYNRIENDMIANAFAYTDSCLGDFIRRLKRSELWDNTLVICIPDHTLSRYPEKREGDEVTRNKIPILLLGGAIRCPKRIETICNQSDLPATILAQLGLPCLHFPFSRNVLAPSYKTPFAYNSFNNAISITDTTGFTLFDIDSRSILTEKPVDSTGHRSRMAKAILQHTYRHYMNQ